MREGVWRIMAVSLAVLFMALAASQAAFAQQQQGVLRGRVVDAQTGEPVPRARLRLTAYGMTVVADDLGVYVFTGVPVGATTLIVSAPGYRDYVQNIQVFGGDQTLDVLLTPIATAPAPAPPAPATPPQPAAPPAAVQTAERTRVGLYGAAGYASVAMAQLNELIDEGNRFLRSARDGLAADGWSVNLDPLDRIERGFWGEGGLRFEGRPLSLAVGVRYLKPNDSRFRLAADTRGALLCKYNYYNYGYSAYCRSGSMSMSGEATHSAWGPVVQAGITLGRGPVTLRLGGGVGYYWLTGRLTAAESFSGYYESYYYDYEYGYLYYDSGSIADYHESAIKAQAQALGYEGQATLAFQLSQTTSLELSLGYQALRFDQVRWTDEKTGEPVSSPPQDPHGNPVIYDFSGLRASAALSLRF